MKRHHLLAGAAALGLAVGAAGTPAMAFDTVNWSWTLTRTDTKTSTSTSALNAFPTGETAVEARQIFLGDSHAEATGTATTVPSASALLPLDATTDLGRVEASAAGYGNVYSAGSEVPLKASVGQFHLGAVNPTSAAVPATVDPLATNTNHAYADKLIADSASGLIAPHQTSATATATGVVDATAAAEARAVSNSLSLELAAPAAQPVASDPLLGTVDPTAGYVTNAIMSADTTQLSVGSITGLATSGTQVTGYSNLGAIDRPLSSAAATSIGNLATKTARIGTLAIPQ
jgi:hypothetical protein